MEQEYIQVGFAAMREADGTFREPFPIYIRSDETMERPVTLFTDEVGQVFADMMRQYVDGCRTAGLPA